MASLEGQKLGPYTVIAQMGSGGMATVYRAHHPRLDRDVAIKMLHEAFQEDQELPRPLRARGADRRAP